MPLRVPSGVPQESYIREPILSAYGFGPFWQAPRIVSCVGDLIVVHGFTVGILMNRMGWRCVSKKRSLGLWGNMSKLTCLPTMLPNLATMLANKFRSKNVRGMSVHAQNIFANICCLMECCPIWPLCSPTIQLSLVKLRENYAKLI